VKKEGLNRISPLGDFPWQNLFTLSGFEINTILFVKVSFDSIIGFEFNLQ
jgi:hypothetical protein